MDESEAFKMLNLQCSYSNGFKAPNWLVSEDFMQLIKKLNKWIAIHPKQEELAKKVGCRYYCYNHIITQPWGNKQLIKATGHIDKECYKDDIDTAWGNLLKLPKEANYKFISEVV